MIYVSLPGGLKQHKEIKHEYIRYPCKQCEFAGSTAGYLKVHIEKSMKVLDIHVIYVTILQQAMETLKITKKENMTGSEIPVKVVSLAHH